MIRLVLSRTIKLTQWEKNRRHDFGHYVIGEAERRILNTSQMDKAPLK
jgi:hypothetical protein